MAGPLPRFQTMKSNSVLALSMSFRTPEPVQRTTVALLILLLMPAFCGTSWAESPERQRFATPLEIMRLTVIASLYGLSVEMQGDRYPQIAAWPPLEIHEDAWDLDYIPAVMDPSADFPDFVDVRTQQSPHRERLLERWYAMRESRHSDDKAKRFSARSLARFSTTAEQMDWPGRLPSVFTGAEVLPSDDAQWLHKTSGADRAKWPLDDSSWVTTSLRHDNDQDLGSPNTSGAPQRDPPSSQWICPLGKTSPKSVVWLSTGFGKSQSRR